MTRVLKKMSSSHDHPFKRAQPCLQEHAESFRRASAGSFRDTVGHDLCELVPATKRPPTSSSTLRGSLPVLAPSSPLLPVLRGSLGLAVMALSAFLVLFQAVIYSPVIPSSAEAFFPSQRRPCTLFPGRKQSRVMKQSVPYDAIFHLSPIFIYFFAYTSTLTPRRHYTRLKSSRTGGGRPPSCSCFMMS